MLAFSVAAKGTNEPSAKSVLYLAVSLFILWNMFPVIDRVFLSSSSSSSSSVVKGEGVDVATLVNANLFDKSSGSPAPQKTAVLRTNTTLSLRGVFKSDSEDGSRAIISVNGGKAKTYKIGDILPGNIKVSEIYDKEVIVLKNDSPISVPLKK